MQRDAPRAGREDDTLHHSRPRPHPEEAMSRSRLHIRLAAASLVVLAAACADDEAPVGPGGADAAAMNADVAAVTGVAIASDLAVFAGSEAAVSATFGPAGAPSGGTCTHSGGTTTCTGGREGTLTVTRTVQFFDAAGTTQQAYDAATTARIDIGVQVNGTASGPQFTSTVQRARALTISGLAGEETQRTWNGTGTSTVQSTFTGDRGTREHHMVEHDTTTNVVWVVAPTRGAYPASGTMVRNVATTTTFIGERSGTFTATRRVLVTFNGTAQVPMQVEAVTRRGTTIVLACTLDLAARSVSCGQPTA